jgi:transcription factor SFP1
MMSGMSISPRRSVSSSNLSSPSHHRLEASFLRDFICCGTPLSTLHDLREHYDALHAQPPPGVKGPTASMQLDGAETEQERADLGNAMFTEEYDFIPSEGDNRSWERWAENVGSEAQV